MVTHIYIHIHREHTCTEVKRDKMLLLTWLMLICREAILKCRVQSAECRESRVESGEWRVESGEWREWRVESGEWRVESAELEVSLYSIRPQDKPDSLYCYTVILLYRTPRFPGS
jgi:hypothetical protein